MLCLVANAGGFYLIPCHVLYWVVKNLQITLQIVWKLGTRRNLTVLDLQMGRSEWVSEWLNLNAFLSFWGQQTSRSI